MGTPEREVNVFFASVPVLQTGISDFCISVMKDQDEGNVQRKGFIWLFVPEGHSP